MGGDPEFLNGALEHVEQDVGLLEVVVDERDETEFVVDCLDDSVRLGFLWVKVSPLSHPHLVGFVSPGTE